MAEDNQNQESHKGQRAAGKGTAAESVTKPPKAHAPPTANRSCDVCQPVIDRRHTPSKYASIHRGSESARPGQALVAARTGRTSGPPMPLRVRVIR